MSSTYASYSTYVPEPAESQEEQYRTPSTQVIDGGTRLTTRNGVSVAEHYGTATFDSRTDINTDEGWRGTATDRKGTPVPADFLDGTHLVTINGIQATALDMAKAGLLTIDAQGKFQRPKSETSVVAPEAAAEVSEESEVPEAVLAHDDVLRVNNALEGLSHNVLETATQLGVGVAMGHMSPTMMINTISQQTGLDPAAAKERIDTVTTVYQAQADDYLKTTEGIPSDELEAFYAFAKSSKNASLLSNAVNKQIYSRKLDGYAPLVKAYFAATVPSDESIAHHGVETKKGSDGTSLVRYQGMWVSAKVAARNGWM